MLKCNNCKADFEKPDIIDDNGEKWEVCPHCRGTEIYEAKPCEICGDWYIESQHGGVCQKCIDIIVGRFVEWFHANHTPLERSVINAVYEGKNLE